MFPAISALLALSLSSVLVLRSADRLATARRAVRRADLRGSADAARSIEGATALVGAAIACRRSAPGSGRADDR